MNNSTKVLTATLVVAVLAMSIVSAVTPSQVFAGSAIGGDGGDGGDANGGASLFGDAKGGHAGNGGNGGQAVCKVIACIA